MTVKQVAIRLKPEGGQDVVNAAKQGEDALVKMGAGAASATEKAIAASDRQVAKLREIAAAANDTRPQLQAQIDRATGVTGGTNASAKAAARSLFAQDEAYERRGAAIKAALDPASAAQERLNDELREYAALARAGKLSTDQLAQAQVAARGRYDDAAIAINRQERGLSRLAMASRLNLARQGADVFTTAAMGMNPAMIAIQQGPQIADAWSTSNLKLNGSLMLVAGSVGLVAAATAVGVAAWMEGEKNALAYERAVSGVGRAAQNNAVELRAAAEVGAASADISLKSAQQQATAYAATGKIGTEVITGLVAMSKDYASFMGEDAADATKSLAKAMEDPAKAARDMTREFGLLDQKTIAHIESLVKLGDRQAAQLILSAALTDAVRGHGDKVGELTSFWDVATRSMSNYWTSLGEWLHTTRDEQVAKYDGAIANGRRTGASPQRIAQLEAERDALNFQIGYDKAKAENDGRSAAGNQSAQEAVDRANAGKGDRDKAKRDAERAAREAERAAKEALQRQRRTEDRESALDMQIAQARADHDGIRRLEEQERVRQRIRQLEDDGVSSAEARTKAHDEEARLIEAFSDQSVRATAELGRQVDLQVMRLLGEVRGLETAEKRIEREARIVAYQKAGLDLATATATVDLDLLQIAEAKAEVMTRIVREAEAEHRLNLARLSGDDDAARSLDIGARIRAKALEIERRKGLNPGEGMGEAKQLIMDELDASALGARRSWLRGVLGDIRRGGIGDAVGEQLDRATDKWVNKLSDALAELKWGAMLKSLGGGGGWSDALDALFSSGHSAGTDFSEGGFKWVGERGPELLNLPRGSKVTEHNRSMQMTAAAASPVVNLGGLTIKNYGSEPVQGRMTQTAGGGLELELEPMFKGMMARSGRDGSLAKALGSSPQPRKR